MTKGTFIPLETLELWLHRMEEDWQTIESEWGTEPGGLEESIANGDEPEIASLRAAVAEAKTFDEGGHRERLQGYCESEEQPHPESD